MHIVQDRSVGSDEIYSIDRLKHILAYKDGECRNKFKDETCTYCNKKGHTEIVCFTKCDDEKLSKLAEKCTSSMAEKCIATMAEKITRRIQTPF